MADPQVMVQLVGVGVLLHIACSWGLRLAIETDSDLSHELFGMPVLGTLTGKSSFLRGRYFLPWVAAPDGLKQYWLIPRLLFIGARLGAMMVPVTFMAFLFSVFWNTGHP